MSHALSPIPIGVPPIDFTLYTTDFAQFAQKLGESYALYGFAVLQNHGIDQNLIEQTLASFKRFFALDAAIKRRYIVPNGGGQRGYTAFGVETAKDAHTPDLKEFWHIGRDLPAGHRFADHMAPNIWPDELPELKAQAQALFAAFDAKGSQILTAIAAFLALEPDYFADKTNDGNSILRVLHYPPLSPQAEGVRAGAHEDINVITLLLGAEEAGLELLDRAGNWLPIAPPPGALVVNIGDMLQRLTNHRLPSTTHRVVNPPPERRSVPRYSMPFFLHFNSDFEIATLNSCITQDNPNRYPTPITAHGYLEERLRQIKLTS
jgi:isopenicillin N synthase-like dioxygenase